MKIKVIEKDIRRGRQGDGRMCPIARALKRTLGRKIGCLDIVVGSSIHVDGKDYPIPLLVNIRMFLYDLFGIMTPFTFDLPIKPKVYSAK